MTLKDRYGFGGFSGTPPSEPNLSTPPPPRGVSLSLWPAVSPGLAAVNRPWAATERKIKKFLKKMVSGAAKPLKW